MIFISKVNKMLNNKSKKNVIEFGLFVRLSVFSRYNSLKLVWMFKELMYFNDVYHSKFGIENQVCRINGSCTGSLKIIALYYG